MISWVFLVVSVIGALFTLNALFPLRRNRWLFLASFVSSWLTIEGALVHLGWQVLATVGFVAAGALASPIGWVGLGICALSWTGLAMLYLQARGVTDVVAESMRELLGSDGAESSQSVTVPRRWGRTVRRTRHVEFARVGGRRLRLDVFEPRQGDAPAEGRPAIVQVHGGGWVLGLKERQGIPLLRYMAARGWVGFNVDYRLSPVATWPDHLVDCKRSIAWVREHAEEYGVDPRFVAVTGGSAGGHLTAMLALTQNDPRYQPGFEEADTSVQAAVPFYGVYDLTNRSGRYPIELHRWLLEPLVMKAFYDDEPERFQEASPLLLVEKMRFPADGSGNGDRRREGGKPQVPPMLLVHGDRDTLTPISDAREMVAALTECSDSPVGYIELRGAQHAFDTFASPRTRRVIRGTHRFLEGVWREYDAVAAPSGHSEISGAHRDSAWTRVSPPPVT